MTLKFIGNDKTPNYLALSTDIAASTIDGIFLIGGTVFTYDDGAWYFIEPDLTLSPYSTASAITGSNGNKLSISGDGQAWVRSREFGSYATLITTFSDLPSEGETLILSDGIETVTFEFDPADDGVVGDNVVVVFDSGGTVAEMVAILIPLISASIISAPIFATVALSGTDGFILTSTIYGSTGILSVSGTASNMSTVSEEGLDDVTLRTLQDTLIPSTSVSQTIAQDSALATSAFDMSNYSGGMVFVPSAWTAANMGFYVCDTSTGTFVIAKDKSGVPIQIGTIATGASGAYAVPAELSPAKFVKLWSKNATPATETDINQAGERSLRIMLK